MRGGQPELEPYLLARRPAALSGGQASGSPSAARWCASRGQVFLFDEPLSNLDAKLRGYYAARSKSGCTAGATSL
ncbi:MAG: hypothetical protein R2939_12635 [Kofleriaceae bacterium]